MTPKSDSPCINVCKLDASGQICLGCYRTLREIVGWSYASDAQRQKVLEELAARKAATELQS